MKIRYVIVVIIAIIVSAIVEKATRVECYSISNDTIECVNYKTNNKWTETSANH